MWPISVIAKLTGTTSRILRHYHQIGLLEPTTIGENGYRMYDTAALVRLQRIFLLREMGISLADIGSILDQQVDPIAALRDHMNQLQAERNRIDTKVASLQRTIEALERKETLMPESMFQGFDHRKYKDEVIERWGADAWNSSNQKWEALTVEQQAEVQREQEHIISGFADACARKLDPASDEVQALVQRHWNWLGNFTTVTQEYWLGLADLYVDDPRFTATYDTHNPGTAEFVRAAMKARTS